MDNKIYYGEYTLKHWIDLILKENIILPEYQRYFVWSEKKVATLINTFKEKQFVPPITIGAFKEGGKNYNLILDGQQRLTSILLAYLGLYPDETTYKRAVENFVSENDDEDESEPLDNVFEWTFEKLIEKGESKEEIISKIQTGNYKQVDFGINEDFLKTTFLGFSYLVPDISNDDRMQQRYYSSVFRNINIQGETLLPQESRASLYFLDKNLNQFFAPDFCNNITVRIVSSETKLDFVRYLSLLSQYKKDNNSNRIARGYKPKMEVYYEKYIYSTVNDDDSNTFGKFSTNFPDKEYNAQFEILRQTITSLEILNPYSSIIDLDLYFLGLIYEIVFEKKEIDCSKKVELKQKIEAEIATFKRDSSHTKAPSNLGHLRSRIDKSIDIYKDYITT